jgi:hypothetical protein
MWVGVKVGSCTLCVEKCVWRQMWVGVKVGSCTCTLCVEKCVCVEKLKTVVNPRI